LLAALQKREAQTSPIEGFRLFAYSAVSEQRPYIRFCAQGSERFMETIRASEALKSRARAIGEELTDTLAISLAKAAPRRQPDPAAKLAASLLVAAWQVAFVEAHRIFHQSSDIKKANKAFLAIGG
jgi:hypothetical protein